MKTGESNALHYDRLLAVCAKRVISRQKSTKKERYARLSSDPILQQLQIRSNLSPMRTWSDSNSGSGSFQPHQPYPTVIKNRSSTSSRSGGDCSERIWISLEMLDHMHHSQKFMYSRRFLTTWWCDRSCARLKKYDETGSSASSCS